MHRYRLSDLEAREAGHVLGRILTGTSLYRGGVAFHLPAEISHEHEHPHVEVDEEVFIFLQGRGWVEVDGQCHPVAAGDIILIEPGEDHHVVSSEDDPLVNLWLHARDED